MAADLFPDLDAERARLAFSRESRDRMIDRLGAEHGLAAIDAYLLLSVAGDLRIAEIVDMPNVIVTMVCPRSIFG